MTTEVSPKLSEWLESQLAPGGRYPSARAVSLAAGLSQNQVRTVIERGTARPDTLARIAKALGVPAIDLFKMAGWLPEADESDQAVTREKEFLDGFRQLPEEDQEFLCAMLEKLRRRPARRG